MSTTDRSLWTEGRREGRSPSLLISVHTCKYFHPDLRGSCTKILCSRSLLQLSFLWETFFPHFFLIDSFLANRTVSADELFPLRAPFLSMEPCIAKFLNENCDPNQDGQITLHEWGQCLGVHMGTYIRVWSIVPEPHTERHFLSPVYSQDTSNSVSLLCLWSLSCLFLPFMLS